MSTREPQLPHMLPDEALVDLIRAAYPHPEHAPTAAPERLIASVMSRLRDGLRGSSAMPVQPAASSTSQLLGPKGSHDNVLSDSLSRRDWRHVLDRAAVWAVAAGIVALALFAWRGVTTLDRSANLLVPGTAAPEHFGSWSAAGELVTPRGETGLAQLADGRVLAVAGRNDWLHRQLLRDAEIFDPQSGQWSATGSLNTARMWFGGPVVLASGGVLVAGGTNTTGYESLDSAEVFDPATGAWRLAGTLSRSRRHGVLQPLADGRALIASGSNGVPDGNRFLDSSELYDPNLDRWEPAGNVGVGRERHWSVLLNDGRAMIGNGEGPWRIWGDTAETFDPSTASWSPAGKMSVGRFAPAVVVLTDGRVMVTGGSNGDGGTSMYATVDLYDPATREWALAAPMKRARVEHAAVVLLSGEVLVIGGYNSAGPVAECEIYDPDTDTWRDDASLPNPRLSVMAVALADGRVLAVGGWEPGTVSGVARSGTRFSHLYTPRRR